MDVDPAALGMLASSETYEHFGTIPVWIHDLERRWEEEDARTRVVTVTGGRRGVGSVTHCMHGAEASIEELLDWRPYDYFTLRNTLPTPMGPIQIIETAEFTPELDGTTIHWRFAQPATAEERAILAGMEPFLDQGMTESIALLDAQLAAEVERRSTDPVVEPALPQARPRQ